MKVTRGRALALLGSAAILPQCSLNVGAIRVGSKNFTESIVIAEIYAQALERFGYTVERHLNLGSTQIALAAMQRGGIDIYPEYTGTALLDVLHFQPMQDPDAIYDRVKRAFAREFGITWLRRSPMNDSQAIATTGAIAERYHLAKLSDLAPLASKLRLATIPEFTSRPDGLPGLQKHYGGFKFASVRTYDIALKYQALINGEADVATAFTTDGAISADKLTILQDDRHLWPPYNVAPLVLTTTLEREPKIERVLNRISPAITTERAAQMNAAVEVSKQDPADVAASFLKTAHS